MTEKNEVIQDPIQEPVVEPLEEQPVVELEEPIEQSNAERSIFNEPLVKASSLARVLNVGKKEAKRMLHKFYKYRKQPMPFRGFGRRKV